jgi:outer membrane protein OmpA-like peptidoglycan-associated protein
LLDALRAGNDKAALAQCGATTRVAAENMTWSCVGRDAIGRMLIEARQRFPGLTFESSARHVGFGIVIEEARVRDTAAEVQETAPAADPVVDEVPEPDESTTHSSLHPMWDAPATETHLGVSVFNRAEVTEPAVPLNMPVRLTVKHDDLQVHEVTLSFPAALLKKALGLDVDPLEMSLSEVQSAFIAPVGAGFTTHTLARPELSLVPPAPLIPEPQPYTFDEEPPPRRRHRVLVPLVVALLAVAAGAGWWAVQGSNGTQVAAPPVSSKSPHQKPTHSASTNPHPSKKPPVTPPPTRKPNVTLKSDLAFGFNSSTLSTEAKQAIAKVAGQVRRAGLTGRIYVDGYTDNIGSAAYGKVLSQKRADAVATYLRGHLGNAKVIVVPVGHGEADPIASNATTAGQKQNRRVTITLPKP